MIQHIGSDLIVKNALAKRKIQHNPQSIMHSNSFKMIDAMTALTLLRLMYSSLVTSTASCIP